MKSTITVILLGLFLSGPYVSIGQQKQYKTVYGEPENFVFPLDNLAGDAYLDQISARSKEDAWFVTSDRDENPFYNLPEGDVIGTLEFGKNYFVVDEQKGWICISEAQVNGLKIEGANTVIGWVPKRKMLLWRKGLVDPVSRINRKVVLLNRADDINNVATLKNKVLVDVYTGPTTATKVKDVGIHSFYFVYKRENNRLLIGIDPSITAFNNALLGWIPEVRTQRWDTRICLEPNFDPLAFDERKQNPALRIKAFPSFFKAKEFCANPVEKPDSVFWDGDPVIQPKSRLASDGRRFIGNVMRMPLISSGDGGVPGTYYYETGMVGEIDVKPDGSAKFISKMDEIDEALLADRVEDWGVKKTRVNVFFLIEGTDYSFEYQDAIIEAISKFPQKVIGKAEIRYGALVYRDIPESNVGIPGGGSVDRMIELLPLTTKLDDIQNFIRNIDFSNKVDTDPWTAMYYGLSEALKKGGFNEKQLNIMFAIGSFGDFRANKFRRTDAKNTNSPALFEETSVLTENLARLDINLYALQLRNNQMSESSAFVGAMYNLILDSSKIPYNSKYANPANANMQKLLDELKKDKAEVKEPSLTEPDEPDNELVLSNAVHPGFIQRPSAGKSMAKVKLTEFILSGFNQSVDFADNFYNILLKMYSTTGNSYAEAVKKMYENLSDNGVSLGYYAPAFAQFLERNLSDVGREELVKSKDNKFHLYSTVYVPAKVNGAKYPTISYTLCMPMQDIIQYKSTIERCLRTNVSNSAQKRQQLYEVYQMLYSQFSGEKYSRAGFDDLQTTDILFMMQGLSAGESEELKGILKLDLPVVKLKDILDERKVPNTEIDKLMKRFAEVNDRFEKILMKEKYEFKFGAYDKDDETRSLNVIYWIPMRDVF